MSKFDFAGWATKNDILCADGRTIRDGAFRENDGQVVPLVYQHQHNDPSNVIGHALLEYRPGEGMYAYASCNNTPNGQLVKEAVAHGDLTAFSIYANQLKQSGGDVLHGRIREVSVVMAGANDGAVIEYPILAHSGEEVEDEAIIYHNVVGFEFEGTVKHGETDCHVADAPRNDRVGGGNEAGESLSHAEKTPSAAGAAAPSKREPVKENNQNKEDQPDMADEKKAPKEETIQDVFDTLTEKQKKVVYYMIGQALQQQGGEAEHSDEYYDEEDTTLVHNIFDQDKREPMNALSHADVEQIFKDAKRNNVGSLREMLHDRFADNEELMHAIDTTGMDVAVGEQTYGFNDPNMLFPDYRALNGVPEWIARDTGWVAAVMSGVKHTPFSRIKSIFANITEDEARAKGYIKGKQKADEVFMLLKRATDPQTIYKRQKMDRDDILDITGFDVVAWLKSEMRLLLDEEIARAILVGDGRNAASDDKIQENHVRSIANDVPLFNVKIDVETDSGSTAPEKAKAMIDAAIRGRKHYKGSGNPTLFTTEDWLTEMLLLEDGIGHKLYKSEAELATGLRVKNILTVPVMENQTVDGKPLMGIIVNLADYTVGADKGGAVNLFDDFDIDYNQYKYLIETRISGTLTKPFSALTLLDDEAA